MSALDNAVFRAKTVKTEVDKRRAMLDDARRLEAEASRLWDAPPAFDNESLTAYLIELHDRLTALEAKQ